MSAPITPTVAERLGYIRFLHQEGIRQATRTHPMSSTAVLSFHDALELFYVLALEFRGTPTPVRTPFDNYWSELAKVVPNLSGQRGSERLNRVRVSLKHHGSIPSQKQVDEARLDLDAFMAANTPAVFGTDYDSFSMVDVVPQAAVRAKIQAAVDAEATGDVQEAMCLIAEAWHELLNPQAYGTAEDEARRLAFGPNLGFPHVDRNEAKAVLVGLQQASNYHGRDVRTLGDQIEKTTDVVVIAQSALRIMTLGLEYPRYLRFNQLTPGIAMTMNLAVHRGIPKNYAPTSDHFQFCLAFVIEAALRIAEVAADLEPPPWATR